MDLNGRGGPIAWAVGASAAGAGLTWVGMIQLVQEPLVRDLAALSRRVDDTVQRADEWRLDVRAQAMAAIAEAARLAEERRSAMAARQGELNGGFAATIGDVTGRMSRTEVDRAKIDAENHAAITRLQEHVLALDRRLVVLEGGGEAAINCTPSGECYGPR